MRAAFSLIELLVVISIIAVLAGMLLPAVGAVRDLARTTGCASNQRQVGYALAAYIGEYARAPSFLDWRITLATYADQSLPSKAWFCPAATHTIASVSDYTGQPHFFLYDAVLQDGVNGKFHAGDQRDLKADFALVYDGEQWQTVGGDAYPSSWSFPGFWQGWWNVSAESKANVATSSNQDGIGDTALRFRHRGAAPHLFGDMHVEMVKLGVLIYTYACPRNGRLWSWQSASWYPAGS